MHKIIKNKFILVILAIAVFIPTLVAVLNYNHEKDGPVDTRSVVSMSLSDLFGNEYTFNKDTEDEKNVIQMFVDMNSASSSVSQLPEPLFDKPFYLVVMSNGSMESTYKYYFSPSSLEAYYLDGDGKAFKLTEGDTEKFLKTEWAASVYSDSKIPSMTVSGSDNTVSPANASWFYKDYSGEYTPLDCSSFIINEKAVYSIEGGIVMDFDVAPDYFHVTVENASDGKVLFDDLYENISNLKFDGAAQVNVNVTAKWYEDSTRNYHGELSYTFGADIAAPAAFYLGMNEINLGEFVSVTGTNVKDPSKVTFESEPSLDYTPTFYADGDCVYSYIPVHIDKNAGTYKFTFKYGGVSQEVNLVVNNKTYRASTYKVDGDVAALYSDTTKNAAKDALSSVFASGSATRYIDSSDFSKVFEDNFINRYFGRLYTVNSSDTVFRQVGVEYVSPEGTDVKATARGEVVYVGETDVTGKLVIIEHGYGLKTIYGHLAEASVNVGDIVEKDGVVGSCGKTGFTNVSGVYFGMYVGDVAVCPYATWHDGDWKGIIFYQPES